MASVAGGVDGAWRFELSQPRFDWLGPSMTALLVLNLFDGLFTLAFLQTGVAVEANPIMRFAYELSPLAFMALKLAVVHLGAWLLWSNRSTPAARTGLAAGALLYAGIVGYHLTFLLSLIAR